MLFRLYDIDESGYLTGEEVCPYFELIQTQIEKVSHALFKSFSRFFQHKSATAFDKTQELLTQLDFNQDGKISLKEWTEEGQRIKLLPLLMGPDYERFTVSKTTGSTVSLVNPLL